MKLLGIDVGTTRLKAGLFDEDGRAVRLASRATPTRREADGRVHHDPLELWDAVAAVVREALGEDGSRDVQAVGVSSMAEAGLLVDGLAGTPRTPVIAWYDRRAEGYAVASESDAFEGFKRTGLHPRYKFALPKLLWLKERDPAALRGATWLSVADYVVFRLTGNMVTDPSLAARTYAFDIRRGAWDQEWLRCFGLDPSLFPRVAAAGKPAGGVTTWAADATALESGTPVAVTGHDHITAMLAAGILEPGPMLDSVGTAESLLGVWLHPVFDRATFDSGLAVVPHVLSDRLCWLGGLSAAGGSVEWLREQLGDPAISYEEVRRLVRESGDGPTGILYYPYLSGSGAPWPDAHVRGAFVGLSAEHRRGDLAKAVLEGTAFEADGIRRTAERLTGRAIAEATVVGGAVRSPEWIQIKADVFGVPCVVPAAPEATLLGAVLTSGLGVGCLEAPADIERISALQRGRGTTFTPDEDRNQTYRHIYTHGYMELRRPLHEHAGSRSRRGEGVALVH